MTLGRLLTLDRLLTESEPVPQDFARDTTLPFLKVFPRPRLHRVSLPLCHCIVGSPTLTDSPAPVKPIGSASDFTPPLFIKYFCFSYVLSMRYELRHPLPSWPTARSSKQLPVQTSVWQRVVSGPRYISQCLKPRIAKRELVSLHSAATHTSVNTQWLPRRIRWIRVVENS